MLSVIMPAYNEAELLEAATRAIVNGTRAMEVPFEFRIVENGSTDGSDVIAARLADEIPEVVTTSLAEADYGIALQRGLLDATGEVGAIFNVDYYDLDFLRTGLRCLSDATPGPAMVLAVKRGRGAHDHRPVMRRAATAAFSGLLRLTLRTRVSDTHGMKVLRLDQLGAVVRACRMGADLFDTELVLRCERAGLPIVELPVTVQETRPPRSSLVRRVPRTIGGLVQLRSMLRDAEKTNPSDASPR